MKKTVMIFALLMAVCFRLNAQSYDYLTFQTADGSVYSMTASGLTITFSDGQMKAQVGSETLSLTLSDLTKMYFSETNGISGTQINQIDSDVSVFTIDGKQMGTYQSVEAARSSLKPGVYVLKAGNKTVKMTVK